MKFVRTELDLEVYGNNYKLRFPTMIEFSHFAEESEKEDSNEVQLTYRLLEKLGLPKSVSEGLEPQHLQQIIEAISPKK